MSERLPSAEELAGAKHPFHKRAEHQGTCLPCRVELFMDRSERDYTRLRASQERAEKTEAYLREREDWFANHIQASQEALRDCLRHLDFEAGDDDQYATGARMKARRALSNMESKS